MPYGLRAAIQKLASKQKPRLVFLPANRTLAYPLALISQLRIMAFLGARPSAE